MSDDIKPTDVLIRYKFLIWYGAIVSTLALVVGVR